MHDQVQIRQLPSDTIGPLRQLVGESGSAVAPLEALGKDLRVVEQFWIPGMLVTHFNNLRSSEGEARYKCSKI
jgi:hypothetical protein